MMSRLATRDFWRSCLKFLAPAPLLVAVALGCSSDGADPPGGSQNNLGAPCQQPGATLPCTCATGQGQHVCQANLYWSACSCSPGAGGQTGAGGATATGGAAQGGGGSAHTGNALPCNVQQIFDSKCHECHQAPPVFGAPMSLKTWDDLHKTATTPTGAGSKISELVKQRIHKVGTGQMPPPNMPQLTDAEKAALTSWVDGGAQPGTSCTPQGTGGAGGGGAGGSGGSGGAGGAGSGGNGNGAATGNYPEGPPPSDCQDFYTMHAHGAQGAEDKTPFAVRPAGSSNEGNTYTCFYFAPPYAAGSQGLWFHPDLDNKLILHHWLLYATDNATHAPGTSAPCQAVEPGAYLVAGWAPGTKATNLPADVGLHMPSGPNAGLILEVHHFNTAQETKQDSSGVTFCTAPANTRAHTAGVSFTGSEGICLQPNAQSQVGGAKSICNPPDNQDIHIINIWPHMHKLGARQTVTVKRAGTGEVVPIHDKSFDFNTQVTYPVNDFVMKPGDTLETTCYFQNTTAEKVKFGERTQDEMCYGFITAWPYQALVSDPATLDIIQVIGAGVQQVNRCMNLVSIFESCNGLADYPTPK